MTARNRLLGRKTQRTRRALLKNFGAILLAFALLPGPALSNGPRFFPDDPVWIDPDRLSIPEPREVALSKGYDLLENTFFNPGGESAITAVNTNTLGAVPDSSWFTNRIGLEQMSVEELVRGPNRGSGPEMSKPWEVDSIKSEGITPGLRIKDGRGDTYLLKFDPMDFPQMTTSAEVIATKFFHAFGYNVPENYLVFFPRSQLRAGSDARYVDRAGRERRLVEHDIDRVLREVPKRPDGTIQAMASRFLEGKPIGPFKFYGTRSDDGNDIFPHQHRRELRGLRIFCAWLNHNDSDAVNTLDMYVEEEGRRFLRHYLIDFGTTFGSGAFELKALRAGNEYYIEWVPILRSALTLGFWDRPWRTLEYPDYPAAGRFESAYFDPSAWKPDYPNPAFELIQPADAFWATAIVMQFSDDRIRALVRAGQIEDRDAEQYLIRTLRERRDKVIRYGLSAVNPLDRFSIEGGRLRFRNLGFEAGLSREASYRFQWFRYGNQTQQSEAIAPVDSVATESIPLPSGAGAEFLRVRIETVAPDRPEWQQPVDVFVRNGSARSVVGIDR